MAKNLLFIIIDQLRADSIGAAGNSVVKTPNLDRVAAEGVVFADCYCQAAPCGPSRMSIYTSRYLCSTRAVNNQTPLRDAEENWGYALRAAGYRPGLIGYNDYAVDPALLPAGDSRLTQLNYDNVLPGFDRVYYHEYDSEEYFAWLRQQGYPEQLLSHAAIHRPVVPETGRGDHLDCFYPAAYDAEHSECRFVTQKAIGYLTEQQAAITGAPAGGSPQPGWVLSLNYIKPHPPNVNCEPYRSMYAPDAMPAAARAASDLQHSHPYLSAVIGNGVLTDDSQLREFMTCYYGMISEVDDNLGLLFDYLRRSGQWDDTVIVVTADHGEYLGDHFLVGKGHCYDGAMHVPCIVRDPQPACDGTRGAKIEGLVETIDLAPTVLDSLGVPIPERFQGRSLAPILRGEAQALRSSIHFEYDYRSMARWEDPNADMDAHLMWVIRNPQFKYVQFADPDMPPLLFDLQADPNELNNCAADPEYQPVILALCQELLRWRMFHEDQRMEHWAAKLRY